MTRQSRAGGAKRTEESGSRGRGIRRGTKNLQVFLPPYSSRRFCHVYLGRFGSPRPGRPAMCRISGSLVFNNESIWQPTARPAPTESSTDKIGKAALPGLLRNVRKTMKAARRL